MRIGIDIMGGDFAPDQIVIGCFQALDKILGDVELILIGNKDSIHRIASEKGFNLSRVSVIHTDDEILMHDNPIKAFTSKPKSSICTGFNMLRAGEIDSFCSAGNTGAMLVGATKVISPVKGIIRPGIVARVPNISRRPGVIIDVGLNPDAKPEVLYQYAILGKLYSSAMYNVVEPKVGLINIGEEEEKGNMVIKATYQLMKSSKDFNFLGNVEGNEIFTNPDVDVLVCDGFNGNIILKEAEGFYKLVRKRNITDEFFEEFNYERFGGTPILGISKPVIVGHGISNARAIENMIGQSVQIVESKLIDKIKEAITE